MLFSRVSFFPDLSKTELDAFMSDLLYPLINHMKFSGLISGPSEIIINQEQPTVYVSSETESTLAWPRLSAEGWRIFNDIVKASTRMPEINFIGTMADRPDRADESIGSNLVLASSCSYDGSPIFSGDTGNPVPLAYISRMTPALGQEILRWQRSYNSLDWLYIWAASESVEVDVLRLMSSLDSDFVREARELCAEIESVLATPVYYRIWFPSVEEVLQCGCKVSDTPSGWISKFASKVCGDCRLLYAFGADGTSPFKDFIRYPAVESSVFYQYGDR
jgi:predicted  nucleic acid-binding Zn ribbon protein